MRPAGARLEVAAQRQDRVAQAFGVEPAAVEVGEPDVLRVLRLGATAVHARHLVRPRQQDPPVQGLDRPAVGDEPAGQPVEQLGVRRGLAPRAEVAGRGDDAPAEVVLPDAIDQHPGRQRVRLRVGQPGGELPPPAPRRHGRPVLAPQDGQEPPRDLGPQVLGVAPALEAGVAGVVGFGHGVGQAGLGPTVPAAQGHEVLGPLRLLRPGEGVARAGEDAVEGVIVLARDRVELVVVAAGAGDRQAEDRLAQRVDRVLDRQVVVVLRVEAEAAGDGQEAGGDDPRVAASRVRVRQPGRRRSARGGTGRRAGRR